MKSQWFFLLIPYRLGGNCSSPTTKVFGTAFQVQPADQTKLIVLIDGEPRTTTLAIAEGVGLEHASVIALVRKHQSDIEEFGQSRFEIAPGVPRPQGGTGRPIEYALLNEQQAILTLNYLRIDNYLCEDS